jgi:hypothetical protein
MQPNVSTPQRAAEVFDVSKPRLIGAPTPKLEAANDTNSISSFADVAGIVMPSSAVVAALYKEREEKRKLMQQLRYSTPKHIAF